MKMKKVRAKLNQKELGQKMVVFLLKAKKEANSLSLAACSLLHKR
jgi:hypothetical protein